MDYAPLPLPWCSYGLHLVLIALVTPAAFCVAASTMTHLQLSSRYLDRSRGDNVARAAMAEFTLRTRLYLPTDADTAGF